MSMEAEKLITRLKVAGYPYTETVFVETEEMIKNSMAVDKWLLDKENRETATEVKLRIYRSNP